MKEETRYSKEVVEKLINIAYEANNHARRLANRYDFKNSFSYKKIDERAKFLSENFADKTQSKIVQS